MNILCIQGIQLISIQRNDTLLSLASLEQCVATRGKYKASVIVGEIERGVGMHGCKER